MSSGLPIIASDSPVHHEVTDSHALFIDPNNIDSIGNAMHQLLNDPIMQKDLSRLGKMRAENFSWEKVAKETLYVYDLFARS